jgi:hypothetical protein
MTNQYAQAFVGALEGEMIGVRVAVAVLMLWAYSLTVILFKQNGGDVGGLQQIQWAIELTSFLIVAQPFLAGVGAVLDEYRG